MEVETGRYNGTKLKDRICKLCDTGDIEDEVHFLIKCPLYQELRAPLLTKAFELDSNFNGCDITVLLYDCYSKIIILS